MSAGHGLVTRHSTNANQKPRLRTYQVLRRTKVGLGTDTIVNENVMHDNMLK